MSQLLSRCKIVQASVPAVTQIGATSVTEVDATKFDRVLYIINTGAKGGASTLDAHIHEAAATGMAGASNITGAALTQVVDTANLVYAIDVPVNPAKPIQTVIGAVAVNTLATSIVAICYNGSRLYPDAAPATQAIIV